MRDRDVVIVSTQDYDDLRTRKQRWAERLSSANRVLYIESQMHWITLLRTWPEHRSRLRRCGKSPRRVSENLWIWTPPVVIPFFQMWKPLARLNNRWLGRRIKQAVRAIGFEIDTLWLYTPYSADLVDILHPKKVIYECVDDFTGARGLIRPSTVAELEDETLRRADLTIVTADRLAERLNPRCANLRLSPNACDAGLFSSELSSGVAAHPCLAGLQRPILGFVGAVAYWVDLDLLAALAGAMPHAGVVVVGPVRVDTRAFRHIPNLHFLGRHPGEEIPQIIRGFDVCLNPYKHDALSLGASPLKLYEYLASGKPIVSTDMPEARRFEAVVRVASDRGEFIARCEAACRETSEAAQHRRDKQREAAAGQTWDARFAEIERWLDELEVRQDGSKSISRLTLLRPPERMRQKHVLINGLQVGGPELGGGYTYLTQLLTRMVSDYPETRFTVISTRPAARHFDSGQPNLKLWLVPDFIGRGPIRVLFERFMVHRIIERAGPDVYFLPYGVLSKRKLCPEVIAYQNLYFLHSHEFAGWESPNLFGRLYERARIGYLRRRLRQDARRADRIVAVSHTAARDLTEQLGISDELITVTHEGPGNPTHLSGDRVATTDAPSAWKWPERFFLSVGAMAPNKNLPALLEGYAAFRDADPHAPALLLAGPDWSGFSRTISEIARDANLSAHVHWLGFVPPQDLGHLYRNAVAAVQLSSCESFGLPVLEAMMAGCPVICADRSGMAEVAGDAALLVNPHDTAAITGALAKIATDTAWRAQWIRRGRRRAREFSWEETARRTYAAFAKAANWPSNAALASTSAGMHEQIVRDSIKETSMEVG